MSSRPHQLTDVHLADPAEAWRRAGFDVDAEGRFALGATTFHCRPTPGLDEALDATTAGGIVAIGLADTDAVDLDGLALYPPSTAAPSTARHHPNGVVAVDHLVVMTPDIDRTTDVLRSLGIEDRRRRVFGPDEAPLRQTFFWLGDTVLEVVGPHTTATDGPATFWGLALTATDLDRTITALGALAGRVKPAVQPGRRICTLRGREIGMSTAVAVLSPHPSDPDKEHAS